jgi:N-acetyl-anhydromuramyl-L-alanine amidase AmpD
MHPSLKGNVRQALAWFVLAAFIFFVGAAEARSHGRAREVAIDMVVIHSTGGPTCDAKSGKLIWVSAGTLEENIKNIEADRNLGIHYMIDRDGTLRSSVPEDELVHHVFHYSGRSVAIELINDGDGRDPFPEAQLNSLVKLLRDIKERRGIKRAGIKRHSDLDHALLSCYKTQRRKVDPGSAFPYELILDRVFNPKID